ncbi:MAG: cyclophilin-like fold protein [Candidatus Nezhaarchaeales archaeon]
MKGSVLIKITFESGLCIKCRITTHENPKIAEALLLSLPFESETKRWGDEVYFSVPFSAQPEKLQEVVDVGSVAYWPEEPSLCLFFGPTPSSPSAEVIKPYSPVGVIGKVVGDPKILKNVKDGERVRVERG